MNLSYHAWRDWKDCPKKYFLKHRKKADPTAPRNDYFKIYGLLVESFFTSYTNIWRFETPYMPPAFIRMKLEILYRNLIPTLTVDWSAFYAKLSEVEIFEQAVNDVCLIMESPESNNLFLNTKSEVSLTVATKNGVTITGRPDFIHTYPVIERKLVFDGKGSTKVKKNVDENQLLYYALLYRLHYGAIPDELGFFYYRFNILAPVEINADVLNEFRAHLSLDIKNLLAESEFKATPCPKSCKYCDYRVGCKEKEERDLKHKRKSRITNLPDTEGIIEFSL